MKNGHNSQLNTIAEIDLSADIKNGAIFHNQVYRNIHKDEFGQSFKQIDKLKEDTVMSHKECINKYENLYKNHV